MGNERRVFVLSIGSVSALGVTRSKIRQAYETGRSGIRRFQAGDLTVPAAELDLEARAVLADLKSRPGLEETDPVALQGLLAARAAAAPLEQFDRPRVSVLMASSRGATYSLESAHRAFIEGRRLSTLTSPTTTLGNLAAVVARELALSGLAAELSSACSSFFQAMALAYAWLKTGGSDFCLCGGSEAPLTAFTLAQMQVLGILARDPDLEPACRPLAQDGKRGGLVLGEGACCLLLGAMTLDEAKAAGALAEVTGLGAAVESSPTATGISPEGDALAAAMQQAIAPAGVVPDAIVVHAPGTRRGDAAELRAVQRVFSRATPALVSNKWQLGHTFGAAAGFSLELALELLAGTQIAPAPYPSALSAIADPRQVRHVLINAAGFGGAAGSVLLSKLPLDPC